MGRSTDRLARTLQPRYVRAMCGSARLSSDVAKSSSSSRSRRTGPRQTSSRRVGTRRPLTCSRWCDTIAGWRAQSRSPAPGLIPHSKDINVGFGNLNAKAEGIEKRPAIREAFQRRRCLVLVDSFCGWKKTTTGKQRYAIALADRRLMALAYGRIGALLPANGCAASRLSLRRSMSCAPSCTTVCRWSLGLRRGLGDSERSL